LAGERYLSPSRPVLRTKWAFNTNAEIETASTKSVLQTTDRGSLSTIGLTRLSDCAIARSHQHWTWRKNVRW